MPEQTHDAFDELFTTEDEQKEAADDLQNTSSSEHHDTTVSDELREKALQEANRELEAAFDSMPQTDIKEALKKQYEENQGNLKHQAQMPENPVREHEVNDTSAKMLKTEAGSSQLSDEGVEGMKRAEEVAREMNLAKGPYMEGVDNAKPGVTYQGHTVSSADVSTSPVEFMRTDQYEQNLMRKGKVYSDGNIIEMEILDTGKDAQTGPVTTSDEQDPSYDPVETLRRKKEAAGELQLTQMTTTSSPA